MNISKLFCNVIQHRVILEELILHITIPESLILHSVLPWGYISQHTPLGEYGMSVFWEIHIVP